MIFLKKIHGNMIFSSNVPRRWSFQKEPHRDMTFLVLSGKMFFFSENVFFPWEESERRSFSRNTQKYEIFCAQVRVLQTLRLAPCQKKSKMILSCKNTPEGDWRSRLTDIVEKAPAVFCTFIHGNLYRPFHILLSSEKIPENLIYRTEF